MLTLLTALKQYHIKTISYYNNNIRMICKRDRENGIYFNFGKLVASYSHFITFSLKSKCWTTFHIYIWKYWNLQKISPWKNPVSHFWAWISASHLSFSTLHWLRFKWCAPLKVFILYPQFKAQIQKVNFGNSPKPTYEYLPKNYNLAEEKHLMYFFFLFCRLPPFPPIIM